MAKSTNPSQLTIDIVTYKLSTKDDHIVTTQDSLLRFIIAFFRVIPPSEYYKLG